MLVNEKKINGSLFKKVVGEFRADDVVVSRIDEDRCYVKLSVNNNLDDETNSNLRKSDIYDISLSVKDEVLYIRYIKEDLVLMSNPDYYETVGIIILLPKNIPYEQVNY